MVLYYLFGKKGRTLARSWGFLPYRIVIPGNDEVATSPVLKHDSGVEYKRYYSSRVSYRPLLRLTLRRAYHWLCPPPSYHHDREPVGRTANRAVRITGKGDFHS